MIERIVFTGDINFSDAYFDMGFGVGSAIQKGENPFKHIKRSPTDYWVGNCECVVSEDSCYSDLRKNLFRIAPSVMKSVDHLDCYAIANNHVMQHGEAAYQSMKEYFACEKISYVGAIDVPCITQSIHGKKVAILAFSQRIEQFTDESSPYYYTPEYSHILAKIKEVKQEVDFLIVYVHWGNEFINYPYQDQKLFAHLLVDEGADLIVGMHPHVLQGFEVYRGVHIFYSIGNFAFNMPIQDAKYGAVVTFTIDSAGKPSVNFEYTRIGKDYFPSIVSKECVPEEFRFDYLNKLFAKKENNEEYYAETKKKYKRYRIRNILDILRNTSKFRREDLRYMLSDFVKRRF